VIAQAPTGKMFTSGTFKHVQSGGKQQPEHFEGGETAVLTNNLGEQVGLTDTVTQKNEEPLEINPFF
jgi:hypothetical protein